MSTTLLEAPVQRTSQRPQIEPAERLLVERTGIRFTPLSRDRVRIEASIRNVGQRRSAATTARIQAAPLGAFVAWRPLVELPVPPIEPGQSHVLRTEATRVFPKPLGTPGRVPPQRVLTALGADDAENEPVQNVAPLRAFLQSFRRARVPADQPTADLPLDLFDLMGQSNPYWAGNLNVFVGDRAVERHLAQALRIYPGRVNMAMFVVGEWPDSYVFHLTGDGSGWEARLYDMMVRHTVELAVCPRDSIPQRQLINLRGAHLMMLAFRPPADCGTGSVEVHVEQRSTGQEAVVEFSFDPRAKGPGCYVV